MVCPASAQWPASQEGWGTRAGAPRTPQSPSHPPSKGRTQLLAPHHDTTLGTSGSWSPEPQQGIRGGPGDQHLPLARGALGQGLLQEPCLLLSSSHLLPCEHQPLPVHPLISPGTDSKSCHRKQNDGQHSSMSAAGTHHCDLHPAATQGSPGREPRSPALLGSPSKTETSCRELHTGTEPAQQGLREHPQQPGSGHCSGIP